MQCILATLNFLTVGITYLSLTSYHILEDRSLQLLGDLDYEVDMEPKECHLKVKSALGA